MPKKLNKVCVICGDRASGFNFNAITCESCKAFFRRNSFKEKSLKCFKGGVCQIDLMNRKYCKKCRLNKCFANGMKTELILSDEQKTKRKIKILENKEIKIIEEINKLSETSSDSNSNNNNVIENLSIDSFDWDICEDISDDLNSNESNEIPESVYREAVQLEFSVIPFERPISNPNDFNDLESSRLQELIDAMTALQTPTSRNISVTKDFCEAIKLLCIKCDHEIRKIIKMTKNLKPFKNINERDQLILLKHSAIEIISLRMSEHFDLVGQQWSVITNTENANIIQLDLLKKAKRQYYLDLRRFYGKFVPEWDSDHYIVDLLTAIVLFDPERPRLNQIEPIRFQRNIYMYLLQRYLQIKYKSDCNSITKFLRLLNTLNDLHIIDEKISKNWSEADPKSDVMPLLKEISNRND